MPDYDSLSYRKYTVKSELDKAINVLEGILEGITIDKYINPLELEELLNWCSLHLKYIDRHPYNEIIPLIQEACEDGELSESEIEDILWACKNFTSSNLYYDIITSDIQILHGLLHGILADGKINNSEIKELKNWLESNKVLQGTYPYDELYSLILSVLKDGIIDESERNLLKVFFAEFIDLKNSYNLNQNEINKLKENINISGICAVCPRIMISENQFCFTGVSTRTKRSQISEIISSFGGKYHDNINKDTAYLIIGDNGNPCWAFSCYGRKVEKAVSMRREGHKILIVHENDFWNAIEDIKAG